MNNEAVIFNDATAQLIFFELGAQKSVLVLKVEDSLFLPTTKRNFNRCPNNLGLVRNSMIEHKTMLFTSNPVIL